MKGEFSVARWMREASFLFPSSRPVERFSSNQFSPSASHCILSILTVLFLLPLSSIFVSTHSFLNFLLPTQTSQFHHPPTLFFCFLYLPLSTKILNHTACRENARSPPAISRSVSLSITHMQTDNPPVHPTCQRKSLSDSCQVCPEVTKKKQETDEERTFRE